MVAISWLQSLNKLVSPIPKVVRFSQEARAAEDVGFMRFLSRADITAVARKELS